MDTHAEVLVIGAGPTGLTLGIELLRHGIDVLIVDKDSGPVTTSNALALQARTLEILNKMDLLEPISKKGIKITGMHIYDSTHELLHVELDSMKGPYPYVIGLPQKETETILENKYLSLGGKLLKNTELISCKQFDGGVYAYVQSEGGRSKTLSCRWLVACDGSHSRVRHLLNLSFDGETMPKTFALADVKITWNHDPHSIYSFLSNEGPMMVFSLPSGESRIVAEVPQTTTPENILEPSFFSRLAEKRAPFDFSFESPTWTSHFTINSRVVSKFKQGNIFLCGDAAHVHSPVGGQGMNTGIQDAYNLAWKLALVSKGLGKEVLLESYEKERKPIAEAVVQETRLMTKMSALQNSALVSMRNFMMKLIGTREAMQQKIARRIGELDIDYSNSPIVTRGGKLAMEYLEKLDGLHHHLFIFCNDPAVAKTLKSHIKKRYRNAIQIHHISNVEKERLCLVRPDEYISYESSSLSVSELDTCLERTFT